MFVLKIHEDVISKMIVAQLVDRLSLEKRRKTLFIVIWIGKFEQK